MRVLSTASNHLEVMGIALHPRQKRRSSCHYHLVTEKLSPSSNYEQICKEGTWVHKARRQLEKKGLDIDLSSPQGGRRLGLNSCHLAVVFIKRSPPKKGRMKASSSFQSHQNTASSEKRKHFLSLNTIPSIQRPTSTSVISLLRAGHIYKPRKAKLKARKSTLTSKTRNAHQIS